MNYVRSTAETAKENLRVYALVHEIMSYPAAHRGLGPLVMGLGSLREQTSAV